MNAAMQRVNGNGAPSAEAIERLIALGDIDGLQPLERVRYYKQVCESLGLNPATQPFSYIRLNGKTVLYAKKDATDQLRKIYNVAITIVGRERTDDLCIVTARATLPDGRTDESIGAVSVAGLKGEALANALMKAETKAKRRVTLSICGLGWLDETEVSDIKTAKHVTVSADGEIVERGSGPDLVKDPDLAKQLAASVDWERWAADFVSELQDAKTKGAVMEIWVAINEDIKRLDPPTVHIDALKLAKEEAKARLS